MFTVLAVRFSTPCPAECDESSYGGTAAAVPVCNYVQDALQYCTVYGTDVIRQLWCRALLACMDPLETVFKDADSVVLTSLVSTVQIPAGPGPATQASPANTAAVSMFDDDLDVGGPIAVSGANRWGILSHGQQ